MIFRFLESSKIRRFLDETLTGTERFAWSVTILVILLLLIVMIAINDILIAESEDDFQWRKNNDKKIS